MKIDDHLRLQKCFLMYPACFNSQKIKAFLIVLKNSNALCGFSPEFLTNIRESLDVIEESIKKGILERQRNIAFNTSVAAAEMLEVYLHEKGLIDYGMLIKHEWFNSLRNAKERLNFDFDNKEKIIELLNKIELKRNILCYGKSQPIGDIKEILEYFNEIKSLFEGMGLKWS